MLPPAEDASTGATLSFAFAVGGKRPRARVDVNVTDAPVRGDLITGIAGSILEFVDQKAGTVGDAGLPLIIPRLENNLKFKNGRGFKPSFVPERMDAAPADASERFEAAAPAQKAAAPVAYGLQLAANGDARPAQRQRLSQQQMQEAERGAYADDVATRPEHCSTEVCSWPCVALR
jgi:hypothetical protein